MNDVGLWLHVHQNISNWKPLLQCETPLIQSKNLIQDGLWGSKVSLVCNQLRDRLSFLSGNLASVESQWERYEFPTAFGLA